MFIEIDFPKNRFNEPGTIDLGWQGLEIGRHGCYNNRMNSANKLTGRQVVDAVWAEIKANRSQPAVVQHVDSQAVYNYMGRIGTDVTFDGYMARARKEVNGVAHDFVCDEVDLAVRGEYCGRLGFKNAFNQASENGKVIPTTVAWVVSPEYDAEEGTVTQNKDAINQLMVFHGANETAAEVLKQINKIVTQSKAQAEEQKKLSKLNVPGARQEQAKSDER